MINCTDNQEKYKLVKTVPSGTQEIQYDVYLPNAESPTYVGKARYFGGDFEIDLTDWVELCWNNGTPSGNLTIVFTFTGSTTSTSTSTVAFNKEAIAMTQPTLGNAYIELNNSDFRFNNSNVDVIKLPLVIENDVLKGKAVNMVEKTTYMDRYNNIHNGTATNRYEIDCFIDLSIVKTKQDVIYEQIQGALQTARSSVLKLSAVKISGMSVGSTVSLECHVKDVGEITTYSRYNTTNRVPSMKITLEVYR